MTQIDDMITALEHALPGLKIEMRQVPVDDTILTIAAESLRDVCHMLVHTFNFYHLSTITGLDTGSEIELLYHFWHKAGVTLRVVLSYAALQVDSLTSLIPGAQFYEREVAEMLGVSFAGLADPDPLFLPDDWDSTPPLRKGES